MSLFGPQTLLVFILLFFSITYFISFLEKIGNWKESVAYYSNHFKKTVLSKYINLLLIQVVLFEILTTFILVFSLFDILRNNAVQTATIALELSAILLLQFLVAQRLAKDYAGATNITVYFILNCIGLYCVTL